MATQQPTTPKPRSKLRGLLIIAAGLILLVSGVSQLFSGGGNGSLESSEIGRDFVEAADTLSAELGEPGQKSQMPAVDDPAVRAFNEQAEKAITALGTPALPVDGLDSFQGLCGKASSIMTAYISAGTGAAGAGATSAAQEALMAANSERYADQMFTPILFSARCMAVHLPALDEQVDPSSAERRAGVVQIREGAFQQTAGLMQMAADPKLDAVRKRRLVERLAADAPGLGMAFAHNQRQQLAAMTQALRGLLPPELQGQADRIRSGIMAARCGKICSA